MKRGLCQLLSLEPSSFKYQFIHLGPQAGYSPLRWGRDGGEHLAWRIAEAQQIFVSSILIFLPPSTITQDYYKHLILFKAPLFLPSLNPKSPAKTCPLHFADEYVGPSFLQVTCQCHITKCGTGTVPPSRSSRENSLSATPQGIRFSRFSVLWLLPVSPRQYVQIHKYFSSHNVLGYRQLFLMSRSFVHGKDYLKPFINWLYLNL